MPRALDRTILSPASAEGHLISWIHSLTPFWELRFRAHERFPARAWRGGEPLQGPTESFRLYGPTCDASDVLPGEVDLPAAVRTGDYLEFGRIGAYSLSGRTRFNGLYSDRIVQLTDPEAKPPGE